MKAEPAWDAANKQVNLTSGHVSIAASARSTNKIILLSSCIHYVEPPVITADQSATGCGNFRISLNWTFNLVLQLFTSGGSRNVRKVQVCPNLLQLGGLGAL